MEDNKPKTFEEIDATLQENLKKITEEIEEIENHLQTGQEMLEKQLQENPDNNNKEIVEKYQKGLEELQKGLEMFLGIKEEIKQTILKLHETKAQADKHIK